MDMEPQRAVGFEPFLRKPLSRRTLVNVLGAGTLAAVAAACGAPAAPTPAPAKPTEAPKPAATATPAPAAKPAEPTKPAAAPAATATPAPAAKPAEPTKPAAVTAPEGGTLVIGMWQEPDSLNPYITSMTYSIWINQVINVEMIRTGKDDKRVPMLLKAEPTLDNGGISKDGKTYKISFKENLKWSDGEPLTGEDLVFTWKTIMDPKFGAGSTLGWEQIRDIELASNKLDATIQLKEVYVSFVADVLTYAASSGAGYLLAKHYFEKLPIDKIKDDPSGAPGGNKYVGAGPYKIVEWKKGQNITVERNPNWVGSKPKLDKIIFSFVATREAQLDGLRTDTMDYAVDFVEAQIPDLEKLPGAKVYPAKSVGSIERYHFNVTEPGSDRTKPHRIWGGADGAKIRTAVIMAMNQQAVVDKILFGKTTVGVTEMDNNPAWFNTSLKAYRYDPTAAEKTLEELGWKKGADGIREKGGVKFEFIHSTTSGNVTRETIQRAFIADLEKVGIRMKIENYKPAEMFANYTGGGVGATAKVDMWGWTTGSTDPGTYLDLFHSKNIPTKEKPDGNNYIGYKDAKMDELTTKQAVAIDPKERKALVDEIQKKIYDEALILYVYDRLNIDVAKDYVVGVDPYPAARFFWNTYEWGSTRKR